MNNWNQLLAALDATLGFPNKLSSTVRKMQQYYDQKTGEHVIMLAYRVRINPGQTEADTSQSKMPLLAEINARVQKARV